MTNAETAAQAPVAVIGYGTAGVNALIGLRNGGYTGPVDVFSNIEGLPYSPILTSYYAGGEKTREQCFPWTAEELAALSQDEEVRAQIAAGLPTFGTCAGLILLAQSVEGGAVCFGTMDIAVRRNAYGRQLGSFYTEAEMDGLGIIPMTFIRAPYIESVSGAARALASVDGNIVAAQEGNQLVTAFHPELNDSCAVHEYFCSLIG